MPSLITHDYFGREFLSRNQETSQWSADQKDAYLLGNQGPDPFFYAIITPRFYHYTGIGSLLHAQKPTGFLVAFSHACKKQSGTNHLIAEAYLRGFLGHYLLDRTVHPFVYSQENAFCSAGIEGLTEDDHSEVHATIEREFDEMVCYQKYGLTVKKFRPHQDILRASDTALRLISRIYIEAIFQTYHRVVPYDLFEKSVHNFRLVQRLFYSPQGIKRKALAYLEKCVRNHSFYASMSHLAIPRTTCDFANDDHQSWVNPFTNECHNESFWDLFEQAQESAKELKPLYCLPEITPDEARVITQGLNFSGEEVEV